MAALWLLLSDSTKAPELWTGLAVVTAGTIAVALGRSAVSPDVRTVLSALPRAWRVAARVPRDVIRLCVVAVAQAARPQPRRGAFRTAAFPATGDEPRDTARSGLVAGFGSVSPNTIVVGADVGSGVMIVHELQPTQDDLDPLGLR